jgi:hypothetical protein
MVRDITPEEAVVRKMGVPLEAIHTIQYKPGGKFSTTDVYGGASVIKSRSGAPREPLPKPERKGLPNASPIERIADRAGRMRLLPPAPPSIRGVMDNLKGLFPAFGRGDLLYPIYDEYVRNRAMGEGASAPARRIEDGGNRPLALPAPKTNRGHRQRDISIFARPTGAQPYTQPARTPLVRSVLRRPPTDLYELD